MKGWVGEHELVNGWNGWAMGTLRGEFMGVKKME